MNVLFSSYGVGDGGAMANVALLVEAYARAFPTDHLTIVCQADSALMRSLALDNVRVVALPTGRLRELMRLALGLGGLALLARAFGADVAWCINFGSLVPMSRPVVLGVHSPFNVYPWSVARRHPRGQLRIAALRSVFRGYLRQADGTFVQTPLMGQYLREAGFSRPIHVTYKAVVDGPEEPLAGEIVARVHDPGSFTFLYVSTFDSHKNHAVAIDALRLLRRSGARIRLALTISKEDLSALGADDLVAEGALVPVGWIPSRQLRALYAACDGCVMPSRLEGLSSAHLEAMRWGLPQVSSDLPFAHDLCGEGSLYAGPDDPADFAEKMLAIAQDPNLRASLVSHGYERVKTLPASWTDMAVGVRGFLAALAKQSP